MESFKQYWNAVWHFETPTDPGVQWFHEVFGDVPIMIALIAIVMTGFALYISYLDYVYINKPEAEFQKKLRRVQETGDIRHFYE